jgi:hypothetical protein
MSFELLREYAKRLVYTFVSKNPACNEPMPTGEEGSGRVGGSVPAREGN